MWQRIKSFLLQNKTSGQTVTKNAIWLSIANFGGRLIKAVIVIYAARVLGAAGYGVFSYAITLAGFFALFVDPGINAVLVREGAKASPEERKSIFSTTLVMKAVVIAMSVAIVIGIAPLFSTLPGAKAILPLVALIIIFDGGRDFFASFFRAEEKMEYDATSFLLENVGIVGFGFLFLHIATTPKSFTAAYVAGAMLGALGAVWLLRRNIKEFFGGASFARMVNILKTAWPFAITGALGILLTNTDILIISWMRTATDVGIYSAAIRIVQVIYLLPGIIQTVTLPVFARFAKQADEKFRAAFEKTLTLIFFVSIPISLGGAIVGTEVMRLIFGVTYVGGGPALSILMLTLSFDYAGNLFASAIFAYNHQKSLIICSAIGGIGNVLFDLLLIPHWGMAGSAIATLLAQILSNSYLWYTMRKLNRFHILPRIKIIAIAGILMAAATALLALAGVNVIINIVISAAVYILALLFFKEPLIGEIKKIMGFGAAAA